MKKLFQSILAAAGIILALEVFVFNFKFWESLRYEEPQGMTVSFQGLTEEESGIYQLNAGEEHAIELDHIDAHVFNVYLDLEAVSNSYTIPGERVCMKLFYTDAANATYREVPQTEVVNGIVESRYLRIHTIGDSARLKLQLTGEDGSFIRIREVGVNRTRPFVFRPLRCLILFGLCVLFLCFQPKSPLYGMILRRESRRQKTVIAAALLFQLVCMTAVGLLISPQRVWEKDGWMAHKQYELLADALMDGHAYLNEEPPAFLSEMENPYDNNLRNELQAKSEEKPYHGDFAYFNGKYYCYFGVVPEIAFFLPFRALTGGPLPTWIPNLFCCLVFCAAVFWFVYEAAIRYKTSLGLYLLLCFTFIAGSGVLYLAHFGNVYSMPIAMGTALGLLGLTCWIRAAEDPERVRIPCLALGSVCMALVVGCRPQLGLAIFLAFPVFWKQLKNKTFFTRHGLPNLIAAGLPFVVVALGLMYYNQIRFLSPFDFGASYNLTGNDMTHRGFVFSRFFLGFFEYLLQPPNVKAIFPFFEVVTVHYEYQGFLSGEPYLGGWLLFNPVGLLLISYIFALKNRKKQTFPLAGVGSCSLAFTFILIAVTIQMSGITMRYHADFGWLLMTAVTLGILMLVQQASETGEKILLRCVYAAIFILSAATVFLNYYALFADGRYGALRQYRPMLFYLMKFMFYRL